MRISDWSSDVCSSDLLGQPVAWYNLGNSLRKLDRYALASNAYRQVLRIDPEHANAWNNLGLSLFELKQSQDAIAAYPQALQIAPKFSKDWAGQNGSASRRVRGCQYV